jgi:hypothetical protein
MQRNVRHLLAVLALALGATPALAQPDPMEEQRCVWRCLAESRGANDPAYHACVSAQCTGRPPRGKAMAPPPPPRPAPSFGPGSKGGISAPVVAPAPRGPAWRTVTDLAYPAVAQCVPVAGGPNLCLVVSCPARGDLTLEVFGLAPGLSGAPLRLSTTAALFDLALPQRGEQEDAYRWPMPIGLAATLKAESAVEVETGGRAWRLSLAGSGSAISEIEARCR